MSIINRIEFDAPFGEERKKVEIFKPYMGGDQWNVLIDKIFHGALYYQRGQWLYYDQWLTMDDVQAIAELIEEYLAGASND